MLLTIFQNQRHPGRTARESPYWRDGGNIDAYYEANMDIRSVEPALTSIPGNGR